MGSSPVLPSRSLAGPFPTGFLREAATAGCRSRGAWTAVLAVAAVSQCSHRTSAPGLSIDAAAAGAAFGRSVVRVA